MYLCFEIVGQMCIYFINVLIKNQSVCMGSKWSKTSETHNKLNFTLSLLSQGFPLQRSPWLSLKLVSDTLQTSARMYLLPNNA